MFGFGLGFGHCARVWLGAITLAFMAASPSLADSFGFVFDKDAGGKTIPSGYFDATYSTPNNNPDGPHLGYGSVVQWPDLYPDGSGKSDGGSGYSAMSGYGSSAPYSEYRTLDGVICKATFGTGVVTMNVYGGGQVYPQDGSADADCAYATTIVAVFSVSTDGSFKPLAGALVTFQSGNPAGYPQQFTTTIRPSATGKPLAWVTFGRTKSVAPKGDPQNPDAAYPSGFRADNFSVSVSCPGYRSAGATGDSVQLGPAWMGKALAVYLQSNTADPSHPSISALGPATADLPTSADGTVTGSGSGSGGSGSGSVFDPAGFIRQLMDAIAGFFTLQQADLDSLKTAWGQLAGWGPFSVPAQILQQWESAFGQNGQGGAGDGSDPNYWVLPLTFNPGASGSYGQAAPAGYDRKNLPVVQHNSTVFDGMFPHALDLTSYASTILTGRFLALIALWLSVAFALVRRFTPDLRV